MGNYRFRFSDMIPNFWFYKLKDMSKSRNQKIKNKQHPIKDKHNHHHTSSSSSSASASASASDSTSSSSNTAAPAALSSKTGQQQQPHQRKSYYFTRDLTTPPPPNNDDHAPDHTFYDNHVATTTDHTRSSPPRKSSKKKRITTTRRNARPILSTNNCASNNRSSVPSPGVVTSTSVSVGCSCRATMESVCTSPKPPDSTTPEEYPNYNSFSENESLVPAETKLEKDIIIDVENKELSSTAVSELVHLPPIITKPAKESCCRLRRRRSSSGSAEFEEIRNEYYGSLTVNLVKEDIFSTNNDNICSGLKEEKEQKTSSNNTATRFSSSAGGGGGGLKLRTHSPRLANKRIPIQARKSLSWRRRRRSLSESWAVMKSSNDPQKDFRESMVEMIVENNICGSKELEDLLACYLSLNSDQYHDLIIRVFKQIWFDLSNNME
ncbi:hypothetical protein ACH5RR_005067 [Cinchona calisaya]|uniref:Transcription repressor n=1 Tax=Cinchona calisaya TaxID=153742 RepID=A0ABD3AZJ3_9GENT